MNSVRKNIFFGVIFSCTLIFSCTDDEVVRPSDIFIQLGSTPAIIEGNVGEKYVLRANGGSAGELEYEWNLDNDKGKIIRSGTDTVSVTYPTIGDYNISVSIRYKGESKIIASASLSAHIRGNIPDIELIEIPAGNFMMGSKLSFIEQPVHKVYISRALLAGKFEITQQQWEAVMGVNPSWFHGDSLPVEQVSWYEAVDFCNRISLRKGLLPCYKFSGNKVLCDFSSNGFRLPTEAEWEYLCRATTTTDINSGKLEEPFGACTDGEMPNPDLDRVSWHCENADYTTHKIGTKQANKFGLYDTHGNVYEWVWDWYGAEYYQASSPFDPTGPDSGKVKIFRGGAWSEGSYKHRSASRSSHLPPDLSAYFTGLRVVRNK